MPLPNQVFDYIQNSRVTPTKGLLAHFISKKIATKQGVYKCLRRLEQEGKIVWLAKTVQINLVWLQKEIDALTSHLPNKEFFSQSLPRENSKATFKIKTLNEAEELYSQLFVMVLSSLEAQEKEFLFYDLHNHTYLNHVPLVNWYIDYILKKNAESFLLVGSVSPLDLQLKKKMSGAEVHCTEMRHFNCYLSVLGNYVISVYLDKKVFNNLEKIFNSEGVDSARLSVSRLAEERGSFKIMLEQNKDKAYKIRKVFKKYFHIT